MYVFVRLKTTKETAVKIPLDDFKLNFVKVTVVKDLSFLTVVGANSSSATFVSLIGPLVDNFEFIQAQSGLRSAPVLKFEPSAVRPFKIEATRTSDVMIGNRLSTKLV